MRIKSGVIFNRSIAVFALIIFCQFVSAQTLARIDAKSARLAREEENENN